MEKIKEAIHDKLPHHNKHSSTDDDDREDSGFEVLGTMKTHSRSNTNTILPQVPFPGRGNIERHISKIPQQDTTNDGDEDDLPLKLKRNISSIPHDDYDSEDEHPPPTDAAALNSGRQHERTSSSDFEEPGLLRITSDEVSTPVQQRSGIERHVSAIPDADEPEPSRRTKLERTISQIPGDDYDSDGERAV